MTLGDILVLVRLGETLFFLTAVGKNLLKEDFKRRRFERPNKKTSEIDEVIQGLKNPDVSVFRKKKTIPREYLRSKTTYNNYLTTF